MQSGGKPLAEEQQGAGRGKNVHIYAEHLTHSNEGIMTALEERQTGCHGGEGEARARERDRTNARLQLSRSPKCQAGVQALNNMKERCEVSNEVLRQVSAAVGIRRAGKPRSTQVGRGEHLGGVCRPGDPRSCKRVCGVSAYLF